MKVLDLDEQTAEDALVLIAEHVPPFVKIGTPRLALPSTDGGVVLLADLGADTVMWIVGCGCHVDQAVSTGGELTIVRWRRGVAVDVATGEG